jgi:cell division protein FtsB
MSMMNGWEELTVVKRTEKVWVVVEVWTLVFGIISTHNVQRQRTQAQQTAVGAV